MSKPWHVETIRHCGITNKLCFKTADSKHKLIMCSSKVRKNNIFVSCKS